MKTFQKYKRELKSLKISCNLIIKKIQKENLTEENTKKYIRLYECKYEEINIIQNYLDNWYSITIDTLDKIEIQLKKIKKNKTISKSIKRKYIKKLSNDIIYLNVELDYFEND
jgi:hypothetical protein